MLTLRKINELDRFSTKTHSFRSFCAQKEISRHEWFRFSPSWLCHHACDHRQLPRLSVPVNKSDDQKERHRRLSWANRIHCSRTVKQPRDTSNQQKCSYCSWMSPFKFACCVLINDSNVSQSDIIVSSCLYPVTL